MKARQLLEDLRTARPRIVLSDDCGELAVPVSAADGALLAPLFAPDYVAAARPPELSPHRLLSELATRGGLTLARVELTVDDEGQFSAALQLRDRRARKRASRLSARPADAIAWALIEALPVFVAAAAFDERAPAAPVTDDAHALAQLLSDLRDDEFGKWKM